jgi:hypothetical protein
VASFGISNESASLLTENALPFLAARNMADITMHHFIVASFNL